MPPVLKRHGEDALAVDLRECRGTEFHDSLAKVKDIPGRRWNGEEKLWLLPADPSIAERLYTTLRPKCDDEMIEWIKSARITASDDLTTPLPDDASLRIPWARRRARWQPRTVNGERFNGLFNYQRSAVDLIARLRRMILADDMGSGKTLMALSSVEEHRLRNAVGDGVTVPDGPKLVIAPASVKGSWKREIERYLPDDTEVVVVGSYNRRVGTDAEHERLGHRRDREGRFSQGISPEESRRLVLMDAIEANAWIIVNWEQIRAKKEKVRTRNGGTRSVLQMKEPLLARTRWLAVIADEIHRAKNRRSQQTRGLFQISGDLMLGMTGTPIMNSPDELWPLLHWLFPREYTSYWRFYEQYVEYWEGPFGKVITGVKNPDALRFELKERLIRRTASQLRGTPGQASRRRIFYPVELNPRQRRLYDDAVNRMWLEVKKDADAGDESAKRFAKALREGADQSVLLRIPNGASRLTRCMQIIESPAVLGGPDDSGPLDDLEDRIRDTQPFQWVVFTKYVATTELIKERLERKLGLKVALWHGDIKPEVRTRIEDSFQLGEIDVIVGTIEALREGVTLTAAHLEHFITRSHVPDVNDQAECRCDRIGQQHQVVVNVPQAVGTVAVTNIDPTNRRKERIVKAVIAKDQVEEVHHG